MKTHAERFRHLLEVWGLTQEELGQLCGIKRGTVGTIVNGKTTPDGDALAQLLLSRPELSPDWLLTGSGPMLRDGVAPTAPVSAAPTAAAGLRLSPDPKEVAEIKQQRDDWRQEAQTWKELYLSSIGKGELAGKPEPDNSAAEAVRLLAGFGEGRGARSPQATTMWVGGREYSFAPAASLELVRQDPLVIGKSDKEAA